MFRVKICGITNWDDAEGAVDAGAEAIGLNFFAQSARCCPLLVAEKIVAALPASVIKVGVFVNAPAVEIREKFRRLRLDLVQLHGDERPECLAELRGLPVMRAFRIEGDLNPVREYLERCHALRCMPRMLLVDAHQPGAYGGTGTSLDWEALARQRAVFAGLPLVLAGGLTAANVGQAIGTARPWAVDTASGVESVPGHKARAKLHEFCAAAREAFARLSSVS